MSNANIEGTLQELWDGMKEIVPEFEWKGVSKNILFGYGKINREINKDVIKDRGIFSRLFRRTTESNTLPFKFRNNFLHSIPEFL